MSDGIYTAIRFTIDVPSNNSVIKLVPFGDVHMGSPCFAEDEWNEFRNKYRKNQNTLFIGMGDYFEHFSGSERFGRSSAHDGGGKHADNRIALEDMERMEKDLSFMGDRLLGLIQGNHYHMFKDGQTSDEKLARNLGVDFFGDVAHIVLDLKYPDKTVLSTVICAFHGHGSSSARLPGSPFNSLYNKTRSFDAHINLSGHDHAKGVLPGSVHLNPIPIGNSKKCSVQGTTPLYCKTGSFFKGYQPGKGSYIVGKYAPSSLGVIELHLERKQSKNIKGLEHIELHYYV